MTARVSFKQKVNPIGRSYIVPLIDGVEVPYVTSCSIYQDVDSQTRCSVDFNLPDGVSLEIEEVKAPEPDRKPIPPEFINRSKPK